MQDTLPMLYFDARLAVFFMMGLDTLGERGKGKGEGFFMMQDTHFRNVVRPLTKP